MNNKGARAKTMAQAIVLNIQIKRLRSHRLNAKIVVSCQKMCVVSSALSTPQFFGRPEQTKPEAYAAMPHDTDFGGFLSDTAVLRFHTDFN